MTTKVLMCLAAAGLMLAGCNKGQTAQPAMAQEAPVSSTYDPTNRPVALTPDGSAANTGNRVNGTQNPATAVGRVSPDAH